MQLRSFLVVLLSLLATTIYAQPEDQPTDYLSKEFHAARRDSLRALMPDSSVVMVLAYPTRNFSNDVDYVYHPNPDIYYFSGYKEPESLLLIFKEPQKAEDGSTYKEIIFVQKRNALAEQWTGRRLGVEGVQEQLGIKMALNGEQFKNYQIDFSKFTKIIFDAFPTDATVTRDPAGLYSLIQQFKQKAGLPENYSTDKRFDTRLYRQLTGKLREIKTPEEMVLLRKAVEISCVGQAEVMKAVRPDMSEREVQGLHEFVHKKYGAENVGYPSIVGAGNNGCVLHYEENNKMHVENRLILMDVGAEYHGYTADVTRTVPANGKFTPEQRAIYEIVYQAQEEAFKLCKEGTPRSEIEKKARDVVAEGLIKLGIISKADESRTYYPHGLSHHIGLDVHDRGASAQLKKDMVVTIEPGIYIPEGSKCDKKWWGIAVRIEDDVLIKEKDCELLSSGAPRKVEDIEKMVAMKSPLDDFILPPLKSAQAEKAAQPAKKKAF
ncbi:MAG: aminopeptidase P N-terminal domain-containing protein [Chitinophagaceae bacterium]